MEQALLKRCNEIIALFAERKNVEKEDARWFFFGSEVCAGLQAGDEKLLAMREEELVTLLEGEYTGSVPYHC